MNQQADLDLSPVAHAYQQIKQAVGRIVVGQDEPQRLIVISFLAAGHSLLEGVPGVAKTLLVRSVAAALGLQFGRVQFTPDLMPSDILGTTILDPQGGEGRFRPGPIFTQLLLADEINRASAKTQAALLEAMQERSVTIDGVHHDLGDHFTVLATQNPVEQEGTYPLPEAELDRFLFKIQFDYPTQEQEVELLKRHHQVQDPLQEIQLAIDREEIARARETVERILVGDELTEYVAALIRATREDLHFTLGASPRAGVMLLCAAKAAAAIEDRDFVLPEDVQSVFFPALRHRVLLDPAAEVEGLSPDQALERTLRSVTVPR